MEFPLEHPHFITITVFEWRHLLKPDKYKLLILDSLTFLVREKRVAVFGFVIMSNHIHLIWQIQDPHKREAVQRDFLKYVAQQIKFDLIANHPKVLEYFEVNKKDRKYQFWKRNALSVDLYSSDVFNQKLDYIHMNPVKAGLCELPEEYPFSSAEFYLKTKNRFPFLSHHNGND
ncbi:REP-associated tyrosine transposase [Ekhidna sp.]